MRVLRAVPVLIVTVAALALSGCSGSAADSTASPSAGSPGSESPSASATASPGGTASPDPTASGDGFALLPEAVLAPIPPLTYAATEGTDQAMVANGAKPAVTAVYSGGISRSLVFEGNTIGGVELYRFAAKVPSESRASFVPLMVTSFAQKTSTSSTLGSTPVEVVEGARGTDISVVGWTRGNDVIIVWANGTPAVQQIAGEYLRVTGG